MTAPSHPPPAAPRRKLAEHVARRIEDEIVERGWPVGEAIGSEARLIERYGVSRAVVREAISILEYKQVAAMRRGRGGGLVVRAPAGAVVAEAVAAFFHFADVSVGELYEARSTLEVLAARLAARRIGEEDIAHLRDVAANDRVDRPLSVAIAQATHNPVLSIFIPTLTRVTGALAGVPVDGYKLGEKAAGARRRALPAIAEAIVSGDEVKAERRVRSQLEGERAWLDRVREAQAARSARPAGEPAESLAEQLAGEVMGAIGGKLPEKVALLVRQEIRRRGWPTGEVLGNEASLCEQLDVSRAVFREAVRILEHNGVARMRQGPGGGLVVQAPDPARVVDALALYLRYLRVEPGDVFEVRTAVELKATELAAALAPHDDTTDLKAALGRELEPSSSPAAAHVEVHAALARLSRNRLLALFTAVLAELSLIRVPAEAEAETAAVHEKIADAVLAGDASLARHRMSRHLRALAP
ncbi:FadR/GntR family transcriptional regulator [Actinomadura livida]|uniref:DNA-binding FadR family transcriptional regulator n=1 Tax=Actinomadura livida TaxID=79909 RepID=A0A7W7IFL5_9ACTN|nr:MULTISPECIES: FCD domain-containing protein [Actinomadura]MBB4776085.1 DNA-binding FadR family transcriptional regulator [Actinomadura catellatispora]GGU15594.1 GntR family transcriptional regulator [Actinomadura livida]